MAPIRPELQRHLHTKHVDCKRKSVEFLKREFGELKHSVTNLTSVVKKWCKVGCGTGRCGEALMTLCGGKVSCVFGEGSLGGCHRSSSNFAVLERIKYSSCETECELN